MPETEAEIERRYQESKRKRETEKDKVDNAATSSQAVESNHPTPKSSDERDEDGRKRREGGITAAENAEERVVHDRIRSEEQEEEWPLLRDNLLTR